MTAAELIAELQKLPPYYPVMLVTQPGYCEISAEEGIDSDATEWSFIGDVQVESALGSIGCVIKIIAAEP